MGIYDPSWVEIPEGFKTTTVGRKFLVSRRSYNLGLLVIVHRRYVRANFSRSYDTVTLIFTIRLAQLSTPPLIDIHSRIQRPRQANANRSFGKTWIIKYPRKIPVFLDLPYFANMPYLYHEITWVIHDLTWYIPTIHSARKIKNCLYSTQLQYIFSVPINSKCRKGLKGKYFNKKLHNARLFSGKKINNWT